MTKQKNGDGLYSYRSKTKKESSQYNTPHTNLLGITR
jgi:hypothetical protein